SAPPRISVTRPGRATRTPAPARIPPSPTGASATTVTIAPGVTRARPAPAWAATRSSAPRPTHATRRGAATPRAVRARRCPRPAGTACSDGAACTRTDICRAGTCAPGSGTVCGALDQCHAAGVCDPATGACSNPEITCDDGDPCTVDACLPAEGCAHFPASGFSSITCVFGAHGELGVCPGESVPAALTRISGDAQRLIAQAAAAPGGRHAKILLKKAVRKLGSAARLAARAGKRQQVSPACAGALRGLYLDGKARTETLVRALKSAP